MAIESGRYRLGPHNARLSVRTERGGAAALAGHDLALRVTSWRADLDLGEDPADTTMELTADATSLRVVEGTGGMQKLGQADLDNIHETIDTDVLERREIAFRSTSVSGDAERLHVDGDLTLAGRTEPVAFDLHFGHDGAVSAVATVKQTNWGMKPYSALLGALKVKDEVLVVLEGQLGPQSR